MTANELQMLVVGIALGAQLMTLQHMWWDRQDARRNLARSRQAWRRAAGDRYLSSLRLYQLQQQRMGTRR